MIQLLAFLYLADKKQRAIIQQTYLNNHDIPIYKYFSKVT